MKEFYLIPKTVVHRYLNTHSKQNGIEENITTGSKTNISRRKKNPTDAPSVENKTLVRQNKRRKQKPKRVSRDIIFSPRMKSTTSLPMNNIDPTPSLDHVVNIRAKASHADYIKSMISLMRSTPGISWDSNGNLLEPVRNLNIVEILKTLGNTTSRWGLLKKDVPMIKMLLHTASVDPSHIHNLKVKRQLAGGTKYLTESPSPSLAQAQRLPWLRYHI